MGCNKNCVIQYRIEDYGPFNSSDYAKIVVEQLILPSTSFRLATETEINEINQEFVFIKPFLEIIEEFNIHEIMVYRGCFGHLRSYKIIIDDIITIRNIFKFPNIIRFYFDDSIVTDVSYKSIELYDPDFVNKFRNILKACQYNERI